MKKTVIIGATTNPERYAYLAANKLKESGVEFVPVGIRKGQVAEKEILDLRSKPEIKDVHTVTLYLNPQHLEEWTDYILSLKPERIIFNPGTENRSFEIKTDEMGIQTIQACTLVMLSTQTY